MTQSTCHASGKRIARTSIRLDTANSESPYCGTAWCPTCGRYVRVYLDARDTRRIYRLAAH